MLRDAGVHWGDQYPAKVGIFQHFLQLMIYKVSEALMESLLLCHVSIFSNYLHFNDEQMLYKLNSTFGNFREVFQAALWCREVHLVGAVDKKNGP